MAKTINILPKERRDQWHLVVNMLRHTARSLTQDGINTLCDELDKYIDEIEDYVKELEDKEGK